MAEAVSADASAWAVRATRLAREMGIPISTGTDKGGHTALFDEFDLLVDAVGMTPADVLVSATSVGAAVLGMENQLGAVRPGMIADLVVYQADPTGDIFAVRHPRFVIKSGRIVRDLADHTPRQ